jgi:phosphoribosylformylglycinamidine synthase
MGKCCTTTVKTQETFYISNGSENNMLSTLAGSTLGVWVSHGEGKFNYLEPEENILLLLNMHTIVIQQI